jgi:hypothetical protein
MAAATSSARLTLLGSSQVSARVSNSGMIG